MNFFNTISSVSFFKELTQSFLKMNLTYSLSPLNFFCPSIIDMILQHFTTEQLILMSETSTDFYQFISTNRKFLGKVKLKIDLSRNISDREFSKFMMNLKRNYRNIHFDGTEVVTKLLLVIKYHKTELKSIQLSNMIFNRLTLLQNFFDFIKNSAEELIIKSVFIFDCDRKISISIPTLKTLVMTECNDQENTFVKRVSFVVSDCENLEYLKMNYAGIAEPNQRKILMNNRKIKNLFLSDLENSFFVNLEQDVKFKLEKFTMRFSGRERYKLKPNFDNFLRSQQESLLNVEISGWIRENVLKTIFLLPKLQTFKVSKAKKCFLRILRQELENGLQQSSSMKELILADNLVNNQDLWQLLLTHAPNLNKFQLFHASYYAKC